MKILRMEEVVRFDVAAHLWISKLELFAESAGTRAKNYTGVRIHGPKARFAYTIIWLVVSVKKQRRLLLVLVLMHFRLLA